MSAPTRVLVVDDSLTVRKRLVELLAADPELAVVGEAEDGRRAIELCLALQPDVITLDMMLPVMTGVAVTEYLMAHRPTPILIVSASTNRGELHRTYDALAAGAVDVFDKPVDGGGDEAWARELIARVKLVARIKVITHLRGKLGATPGAAPDGDVARGGPRRLVAIGGSTGGPSAVVRILRQLPATFPCPILLVLHIGQPFGLALADWLDAQTGLRVRPAVDGERLAAVPAGHVIMASPDRHLRLTAGQLRFDDGPPLHSCRPSIDVLFGTLAASAGAATVACLLTGMGRDGAAGMRALRDAGALTIAQDEATSVIFGMPREAIALGGAEHVLPLDRIAPTVLRAVGGAR